jgi:hypothetical protein
MRIPGLALCLLGFLPTAIHADMLPGADDPAYIDAITLALTTDNPRVLADLHTLAVAGNIAALVALPTVERWLPPTGTFKERAALRKINGAPVTTLADAASPISRLWRQGVASNDMAEQRDRAVGLYALGETTKGDTLLSIWFNQTGGFPPLPDGFANLPASAWLLAAIIENRLNPFVGNPTPDTEGALNILNEWLSVDRLEGWIVLAHVTGLAGGRTIPPEEAAYVDDLLTKVFADPSPMVSDVAPSRMAAAALVWNAAWRHAPDAPLNDTDLQTLWQTLSPRTEFTPVTLYCVAHCPADPPNCERAYLQAFGYQPMSVSAYEPQSDAISPATYYASPRGERLLMTNSITYALRIPLQEQANPTAIMAIPSLAAAAKSDACFATAVTRVLTTPLPAAP